MFEVIIESSGTHQKAFHFMQETNVAYIYLCISKMFQTVPRLQVRCAEPHLESLCYGVCLNH